MNFARFSLAMKATALIAAVDRARARRDASSRERALA